MVALASGLAVPRASGDQISDLRSQAAALASRIQSLGQQDDALAQKYDASVLEVQTLQAKVTAAAQQVAAAEAHADRVRSVLRNDAIQAYVRGGSDPLSSGAATVTNATNGLLRAEYANSLATNENEAIDQYRLAGLQEQAAKANLQQQTTAAQHQVAQVAADRRAVSALDSQLQGLYHQDTGRIATLVAQAQAAAAAAAAQQAAERLASERAAAAAAQAALTASNQSNSPGPSVFSPPPPVGHGASGAVAAAESRLGDWYQWGASGPNTFDCSGLVMWSYAQVGISLPHFSGAQYADTTHIPMSDVQPGDLVFPSDPGEHVAMYIGNGQIIEAPYTGAQVHIIPMSSWFVLASRVA